MYTSSARFWAGIVGINVAAALLANFAFGGVSLQSPLGYIVESTAISFLFSTCCSTLCIVALPRLVPLARRALPFPLDWAVIVLALIGFASAGRLVALFVLASIGRVSGHD